MSMFSSALNWYQKKIGAYDKQLWEKNVDQRILRGMISVPRKLARIKTELIDIDLVRGSAFTKAKPQHSWIAATLSGVVRVLFLPLYFKCWKLQTNALVSCTLVLLYILQIFALYLFYSDSEADFTDVPTSEAVAPVVMMLSLGILHSQIVATFTIKGSRKRVPRTKRKRMKRKARVENSERYENKSSPETASEGRLNESKVVNSSTVNYGYRYNRISHCSNEKTEQNGGCHSDIQQNVSKKCSDAESGLDVMDTIASTDKEKSVDKNDCDSNDISDTSNHCLNNCERLIIHTPYIKSERKIDYKDIDNENVSSGEEYFIARKISKPKEEWKDFIFNLDHNRKKRKPSFIPNGCVKNSSFPSMPRRFSDVGPAPDCFLDKEQLEARFSEDNVLSQFSRSRRVKQLKEIQGQKNGLLNYSSDGLKSRKRFQHLPLRKVGSSGDSRPDTTSPNTPMKSQLSDLEWPIITNTDCNSDSSDSTSGASHDDDEANASPYENPFAWEIHEATAVSLNAGCTSSDKVSCTIWERNECQKVDLSALDISSAIIRKVDSSVPSSEYLAIGLLFAVVIALLPLLFRLQSGTSIDTIQDVTLDVINFTVPSTDYVMQIWYDMVSVMIGSEWRVRTVILITMTERFILSLAYFFLLSVAEKTFKQRFLYAKHFSYLTSSRRARRTDLPHFRLNKVRNIKTWLSVRSYLKKLGPQRSVDVIVSVAFILEVCVLSFLCVQLLKETGQFSSKLHSWETIFWTLALGFYLLRFMIIGSKLNKKYRNRSVLITEQINLYLHMEQKPHKKEELMLANSVLKLAADLLKELESPFKISGLCANPYLYNIMKVVVLSAFSAVLTEILGFKLKLYKIKLQ